MAKTRNDLIMQAHHFLCPTTTTMLLHTDQISRCCNNLWRRGRPLSLLAPLAAAGPNKNRDHSRLSDSCLLKLHLVSYAANTCACDLRSPFCGCSATTPTSSPNRARSRPTLFLLRRQGAHHGSLQPRLVCVWFASSSSSCYQRRRWLPNVR